MIGNICIHITVGHHPDGNMLFLFICWNWVWSTIYIMWIFPFSYLRPYANICIWIWFLAYPCSSSIGGRGFYWFWMSEKLTEEGKMKEITFR